MQFIYETDRLRLEILPREQGWAVCRFYEDNRDFLEPFEPRRPENFYTREFQSANLACEHRGFLNLSHIRYWLFSLDDPASAIPIGSVCFNGIQRGAFQKCAVGYKLGQASCHRGYMLEALSFLIPLILDDLKLHRIEAFVQPDNASSLRLLTRLGFREEGYLSSYAEINGQWKDHLLFSYINPKSR